MPSVPVLVYPTLPVQTTGGTDQSRAMAADPRQSIGGARAQFPLPPLNPHLRESSSYPSQSVGRVVASAHRLFTDFTAAQLTAGRTVYRGVMIQNVSRGTLTDVQVYTTQPASGTAIKLQTGLTVNTPMTRLADETTSPGGVFTDYTSASKGTLAASLALGDYVGLWIEQVVGGGQAASFYDYWGLHFSVTGTTDRSFYLYQNLLAERAISTVTTDRSGDITYVGKGETFTVTMDGAPTDPAGSKVLVFIQQPQAFRGFSPNDMLHPLPGVETMYAEATRSSAGVYTYKFLPTHPGWHRLRFDIGEDFHVVERDVRPG